MRADDLSSEHLGETVTLETPEGAVTGMLCAVRHEADLIDDSDMMDATPRYVLGGCSTHLTLAGWGERQIAGYAEVAIGRTA